MAYVVMALGVLMAAVGLYSVVFGYPLVETEHGPASLIAGSVLLSGGLVVIALGLAIRTLAEIRSALRAGASLAVETPPAAVRIEPPPVTPVMPPHDAVPALAGAAAAPAALWTAEPADEESPPRELVSDPIERPPLPAIEPEPEPEHHAADAAMAEEPTPHEPTPDGYQLQSPSTAEHDIAHAEPPRAPSPEEDWLDRALSDFETGLSPTHPAEVLAPEHVSNAAEDAAAIQAEVPPVHPEPAAATPAAAEPAHDGPVDAAPADVEPPRPVPEPQAPPAQEPAPHDQAVIGRYESDGTSYVMYADGSIEAQSEAGVYRFRSMAELKAFIEG